MIRSINIFENPRVLIRQQLSTSPFYEQNGAEPIKEVEAYLIIMTSLEHALSKMT
jgi:hypothetical protein